MKTNTNNKMDAYSVSIIEKGKQLEQRVHYYLIKADSTKEAESMAIDDFREKQGQYAVIVNVFSNKIEDVNKSQKIATLILNAADETIRKFEGDKTNE